MDQHLTGNGRRQFGTGDLLILCGAGISLLFNLICFVKYLRLVGFDWIAFSFFILMGLSIGAIGAWFRSRTDQKWLLAIYGWTAFIVTLSIGKVSTLTVAGGSIFINGFRGSEGGGMLLGADFYIVLGAVLAGVGVYFVQKGIWLWSMPLSGGGMSPEVQLRNLKDMFEKGLITNDDYDRKRQELVGKI